MKNLKKLKLYRTGYFTDMAHEEIYVYKGINKKGEKKNSYFILCPSGIPHTMSCWTFQEQGFPIENFELIDNLKEGEQMDLPLDDLFEDIFEKTV